MNFQDFLNEQQELKQNNINENEFWYQNDRLVKKYDDEMQVIVKELQEKIGKKFVSYTHPTIVIGADNFKVKNIPGFHVLYESVGRNKYELKIKQSAYTWDSKNISGVEEYCKVISNINNNLDFIKKSLDKANAIMKKYDELDD